MANTPGTTTEAEVEWLLAHHASLTELASDRRPLHQIASDLRKKWNAREAALLLEQRELRMRAAAKFASADRMLFTRRGYEQATDEWLAIYKARRFARFEGVADLCCGIGGDTAAMATGAGRLVACDRDVTTLALARHNVRQMLRPSRCRRIEWSSVDVRDFAVEEVEAWHVDPDRRASGRRTTQVAFQEPDDLTIDELASRNPNVAIKLAPASETPKSWSADGELEWVSRAGECRQLVVWRGELATAPGQRRATLLPSASSEPLATLVGQPQEIPSTECVERYCYEADPALLAADLVSLVASERQLARFSSTHAWLTGSDRVAHPALKGYEVLESLPLQTKRVAALLRTLRIGRLVIKHRAVTLDPVALARQLRPVGENQGVLMVTRIGERRIALVCRPLDETADTV